MSAIRHDVVLFGDDVPPINEGDPQIWDEVPLDDDDYSLPKLHYDVTDELVLHDVIQVQYLNFLHLLRLPHIQSLFMTLFVITSLPLLVSILVALTIFMFFLLSI